MTKFRPCIDLHQGAVKQIVGGTLDSTHTITNYVSLHPAEFYANLYKNNQLEGGHVIMLGSGNIEAAQNALNAWKDHLQIGGGITDLNALEWINNGASKVIVTSFLFPEGKLSMERLSKISELVGKERLVIDLSCRRRGDQWFVAMNKWQTITDVQLNRETIALLEPYCSEFLIHAADVEGLCRGIDSDLVTHLGKWVTIPCCYAGGAQSIEDLDLVKRLSFGKVDLTLGSCLDIFGGKVLFTDCVQWNKQNQH